MIHFPVLLDVGSLASSFSYQNRLGIREGSLSLLFSEPSGGKKKKKPSLSRGVKFILWKINVTVIIIKKTRIFVVVLVACCRNNNQSTINLLNSCREMNIVTTRWNQSALQWGKIKSTPAVIFKTFHGSIIYPLLSFSQSLCRKSLFMIRCHGLTRMMRETETHFV